MVDITHVCQNCKHGNNKKGKWIRRLIFNQFERGTWNIYCEKKEKYMKWDTYKKCYEVKY